MANGPLKTYKNSPQLKKKKKKKKKRRDSLIIKERDAKGRPVGRGGATRRNKILDYVDNAG